MAQYNLIKILSRKKSPPQAHPAREVFKQQQANFGLNRWLEEIGDVDVDYLIFILRFWKLIMESRSTLQTS
jgi:hypothetical protein